MTSVSLLPLGSGDGKHRDKEGSQVADPLNQANYGMLSSGTYRVNDVDDDFDEDFVTPILKKYR